MTLPLMLAGPIVRRVEPNLVSVWVALSRPAKVSLSLWEGRVQSGAADFHARNETPIQALRVGEALYVAVPMVKMPAAADKTLKPGVNYSYDIELTEPTGAKFSLESLDLLKDGELKGGGPSQHLALGYDANVLPSFSLPPERLEDLRIVYGSCRLPCSQYLDAMQWIDDLIMRAKNTGTQTGGSTADALLQFALTRPHQLFLGGDQIYADDVSPLHLHLLNRLGNMLISGDPESSKKPPQPLTVEHLRVTKVKPKLTATGLDQQFPESLHLGYDMHGPHTEGEFDLPARLDLFPPGGRLDLTQIEARMTTTSGGSHLMSFGEFAAMYIMVWSNTCWGDTQWPTAETLIEGAIPDQLPPVHAMTLMDAAFKSYAGNRHDDWESDKKRHKGPTDVLLSWLESHQGRSAFDKRTPFEKGLLRHLMKALQTKVVRHMAERVGTVLLTDCAAIRDRGRFAINDTKERKVKDWSTGNNDWWSHVQMLSQKMGTSWSALVKESLAIRHRVDEQLLEPVLVDALSKGWTGDPATSGEDDAWNESEFTNLGPLSIARCIEDLAENHVWNLYRSVSKHREQLQAFEKGLPKVRRALANVPTYMIFDDHDITDDWNLNPKWCDQVFGSTLGRQIVRNGMAAYAIFQDWGNDPARYENKSEAASSNGPSQLLDAISRMFPAGAGKRSGVELSKELDPLLGMNFGFKVDADGVHTLVDPEDPPAPVRWHFSIGGPKHTVAVLDNRTRRSFVSRDGPPGNVSTVAQAEQIPAAPLADGREVLIVVAPLEVLTPSIFDAIIAPASYRAFDLSSKTTPGKPKGRGFEFMAGTNPDAIEGWGMDMMTFEALLERLAPHRKVLLLSGDVHHSSATQMSYWRKDEVVPSRIVQFTGSGMKNVMPDYLVTVNNSLAFAQQMIRSDAGAERLAWRAGAKDAFTFPTGKDEHDVPLVIRKRIRRSPALLPTYGWPVDRDGPKPKFTSIKADRKPDWSWRLTPVLDTRPYAEWPPMGRPLAVDDTKFEASLKIPGTSVDGYQMLAARHQDQLKKLGNSRQILFRSNIAVVRFERRKIAPAGSAGPSEALDAVHELYTVIPNPGAPSDAKPEAFVIQRASLTPLADDKRPEDQPLKGGLAESLR